jgi:hypothetical protein
MGKYFLWAILFSLSLTPRTSAADDNTAAVGIPGSATYPSGATKAAAPAKPSGSVPSIVVPTPDTIAPPAIPGTPSASQSLGRYRNARGEVKIESLLHDRYKQSVVRVVAKDLAGNVLAKAMGVGVGRNAQYIAAPLSLILGSSQQWADKIEITHFAGNKYDANVAYIDEEKNLVLLSPEASPAPIVFTREQNERPQIDVFTISFDNAPDGTITSAVHRGRLAAANPETGLLSVSPYSGQVIDDSQAGTGLLDSEGNLVGMLLPGGRGVLSSTLQRSIAKAQRSTPLEPRMIGVILGRGVLVDPKLEGAFKTISDALDAIKKGTAPKTDPTRYNTARNRAVAPKGTDKVVVKVMPGTYKEKKPILIPSDLSLSGSGPRQTTIVAPDPEKPAILVQNASNVIIAGFRIRPAAGQKMKAPALILSKSSNVTLLGNVFEAKGGVAAWAHDSQSIAFHGNTFSHGADRGLSCDNSTLKLEANAFLGEWPVAFWIDKKCSVEAKRNLFLDNKNSVNVAASAGTVSFQQNTFIRAHSAVVLNGVNPLFTLQDNVFFECPTGFTSGGEMNPRQLGRNALWRSKFMARSKPILLLDSVRTEPGFDAPGSFDFRIQSGKGQVGAAVSEPGADLGAYQRKDFLGPYSGTLARSLGAATGEDDLAGAWGLTE